MRALILRIIVVHSILCTDYKCKIYFYLDHITLENICANYTMHSKEAIQN